MFDKKCIKWLIEQFGSIKDDIPQITPSQWAEENRYLPPSVTNIPSFYSFEITPGKFPVVTDPNGKTARFCIHTIGFSCNPIDEVVIAYLHIRNRFDEWMDMAIIHNAQSGFQRERKT